MTFKLNLFFIAMDLLTLLVYPVMFVYGKLRRLLKSKEKVVLIHSLSPVFIASIE